MKKKTREKIYPKTVLFQITDEVSISMKEFKSKTDINWSNYLRECVEQKLKSIEVATNK